MSTPVTPAAPITAHDVDQKRLLLIRLIEDLWEKIKAWIGDATVRTTIRTRLDAIEQAVQSLCEESWNDYTALGKTLDNMIVAVEKQIESLSERDIGFITNNFSEISDFLGEAKSNEAGASISPQASYNVTDVLKDFGPIHDVYQKGGRILVGGDNKTKVLRITNSTITEGEEDLHQSFVIEAEDIAKPVEEIIAGDVQPNGWGRWGSGDGTIGGTDDFRGFWSNLINNPAPTDDDFRYANDTFRKCILTGIQGEAFAAIGSYANILTKGAKAISGTEITKTMNGKTVTVKADFTKEHLTLTDSDTKPDSIEISYNPTEKTIVGTYCVTGSSETQNVFSIVNIGSNNCTMKLNLPDPSFAEKWLLDNVNVSQFLTAHGVNDVKFQEVIKEACQNPGVNDFTHVSEENYVKLEALEEGLKKRFEKDNELGFFLMKSDLIEREGFDEKVNVSFLRITDSRLKRSYLVAFNESGEAKSIYEKKTIGDTERYIEIPKETNGLFRTVKNVEQDIAIRAIAKQQSLQQGVLNTPQPVPTTQQPKQSNGPSK